MVQRKPVERSPHWNANLDYLWKAATKARKRAKSSHLEIDWDLVREKEKFRKGE